VGIDIDLNVGDIRHRHLLFRYRREICRTENRHSDIGSVPISTSKLIPISDIEEKNISSCRIEPTSLGTASERYNTKLLCLFVCIEMSDIRYRISDKKFIPISDIISDSALSVRYRKFRYQAQSDIADHGYRTKCPPMSNYNIGKTFIIRREESAPLDQGNDDMYEVTPQSVIVIIGVDGVTKDRDISYGSDTVLSRHNCYTAKLVRTKLLQYCYGNDIPIAAKLLSLQNCCYYKMLLLQINL
jgi:hypothetical protein